MPIKDREKQRAYMVEWRKKHPEYAGNKRREKREKISQLIKEIKEKPCTDCGIQYPHYVMQFDHVRGDKIFSISSAYRFFATLEEIEAEVAKCELVCANCHAARSWERKAWIIDNTSRK